ncbi:DEKNAAC102901 [Brettanomyces naardenensis]|uniref:DEKNAAC102901 n=1 Tax=Brettanomyces naardenensis TaxID=13370 RepID=A0A448YM02_BRENA|nr:DEKNAAC102901 [Brettanomyces naardenensis]
MTEVANLNVDLEKVDGKYFIDPSECDQVEKKDNQLQFKKTTESREGRSTQVYNKKTYARLVAGCLALNDQYDKVLMISSSKHKDKWIFPKGGIEFDEIEDFRQTARRETWEEAGVTGKIIRSLPVVEDHRFLKKKKVDKHFKGIDLTVDGDHIPRSEFYFYEMLVTELSQEWPEMHRRQRKWCTYEEAKHELIRAERPELLSALNESRIAKDVREVRLDEHSSKILDARPEEDDY